MFIKRILIMSQANFWDYRVYFGAFFPTTFLEIAVYSNLTQFPRFFKDDKGYHLGRTISGQQRPVGAWVVLHCLLSRMTFVRGEGWASRTVALFL